VTDWRGQTGVDLPGGYRAERASGTLRLTAPADDVSERACRPGAEAGTDAGIENSSAS
jgi:hypothetical protein